MKEGTERKRWKAIRGILHTIHLWLGVGSGLILFVICLTGTVYTFSTEIQKFIDSELYTVHAPDEQEPLDTETLISHVLRATNGEGVVQSIVIPEGHNFSYQITVGGIDGPGGKGRGMTYFINPYSAEVLGTNDTSSSAFFMTMFRLHRWLLLDTEIGRPIVGVATLIFVVIILSGLVIWFPKKIRNWRNGLRIKMSANWKRTNHDLHTAFGLYSSLFLLVMALTGLTWSFDWYKTGFLNTLGVDRTKGQAPLHSVYLADALKVRMATYLSSADVALPYPGNYRITLPSDSAGVVTIMKTKNSFFATSVADRVILDQYTGRILRTELFLDKPFNEQVAASIKAIHMGSFYGTFSKIIYFITCLIGTSLPVTGIIIWINKLRKKKNKMASEVKQREVSVTM